MSSLMNFILICGCELGTKMLDERMLCSDIQAGWGVSNLV